METPENVKTITYDNGNFYHGDITSDHKRHGYGIMCFKNGHCYKGEYKNDKRNGYGVYTFGEDCNEKYEGNFIENKRDGFGVYRYSDGTSYSGSWRKNLKQGSGVLAYPDGVIIKGIFFEGIISFGELEFPNGSKYIGEIKANLMHGKGNLFFSDGFEVESEFLNDRICKDDKNCCCFCLDEDCERYCYEYFQGICSNPEVISGNTAADDDDDQDIIKEGYRVKTKIIENDLIWSKCFQGIARKVTKRWIYVKFDDGDYLMVNKDLLEKI